MRGRFVPMTPRETGWTIRPAEPGDAGPIAAIYNEAVRTTVATFDTTPRSREAQRQWLADHAGRLPVLVAEREGTILGWASLSAWSDRRAYDGTAEVSFYVRRDHQGRGIGRRLLEELIRDAGTRGLHTLVSRIADANPVSTHLHRSLGFRSIGVMREVGFKFDRWVDVELFQRMIGPVAPGRSDPGRPRGGGPRAGPRPRKSSR